MQDRKIKKNKVLFFFQTKSFLKFEVVLVPWQEKVCSPLVLITIELKKL